MDRPSNDAPVVLVLSDSEDEHAVHVCQRLADGGHRPVLIDSRWFPSDLQISLDPQPYDLRLRMGQETVSLDSIRCVYWRSYPGMAPVALPDEHQAYIASNDARSLWESVLVSAPVLWVNGWEGYQLHQVKLAALARVAGEGVSIPATIATNDPEAIRQFAERHERIIFKPVQGGAHARRLQPKHLTDEHLGNLRFAPVTLQQEITGTQVRVFVAGDRVEACEIVTPELDFRDDSRPQIRAYQLDDDFRQISLRVAQQLCLVWTGMDWIRQPDGRWFFLEANPSPMFLGFEYASGLPLTEMLLGLLTQG